MKTITITLLTLVILSSCSKNDQSSDEPQQPQFDVSNMSYDFKTVGEEKEDNVRLVSQIQVTNASTQALYQTLDGFEAEVQKNEEVIVEDLNFDGAPDIRLMQYLPTDESIAYFYWIYDTDNERFVRNESLENKIFSPMIDTETQTLVSQWRKRDGSWGSDFYQFIEDFKIALVKQEIHTPVDGKIFNQKIIEVRDGTLQTVKDSTYQMNDYLPF